MNVNFKYHIKAKYILISGSKSGYFDTGFFCPIGFFCRQVSVKIVLYVIHLENNRTYLSSGFFCLSGYFVVLAVQSNGQNNPISTVAQYIINKFLIECKKITEKTLISIYFNLPSWLPAEKLHNQYMDIWGCVKELSAYCVVEPNNMNV